jgi:DNA-directed RNA polymerase alpha subunit
MGESKHGGGWKCCIAASSSTADHLAFEVGMGELDDATPLDTLGLSLRALNTAKKAKATTIGHLRELTEEQIMATSAFPVTALAELRAKLGEFGLRFRSE